MTMTNDNKWLIVSYHSIVDCWALQPPGSSSQLSGFGSPGSDNVTRSDSVARTANLSQRNCIMGAKKNKGKKKNPGVGRRKKSVEQPLKRLNDVSSLLFNIIDDDAERHVHLPFVGPIALEERRNTRSKEAPSVVVHGRGLVTTRDVVQGECLFAVRAVASVDVADVYRLFMRECVEGGGEGGEKLEQIAEERLVEQVVGLMEIVKDEIQPEENVDRARRLLSAFSAQMSSDLIPNTDKPDQWMEVLLGSSSMDFSPQKFDRNAIRSVIRRNAFGPDYHNYDTIAGCWATKSTTENRYQRLLAVYPVSAIINHSCTPNAVKVFGRIPPSNSQQLSDLDEIQGNEVMIVHANTNIAKGAEITWSYLPPTTPFAFRRAMLRSKYGFTCRCSRCIKEEAALNNSQELWELTERSWSMRDSTEHDHAGAIADLEKAFASEGLSNEEIRYLRVGLAPLYMKSFNSCHSLVSDDSGSEVLKLATQLHFSFAACNNASTEHLSILHLCYDLSASSYARATTENDPDASTKAMTRVRFYTEQLKKTHLSRYGELNGDVEKIRQVMKHTRVVLRNVDGFLMVKDHFI
ncbi:hypothetical protein ACHAWF_015105 [Thalassiosira exigua]